MRRQEADLWEKAITKIDRLSDADLLGEFNKRSNKKKKRPLTMEDLAVFYLFLCRWAVCAPPAELEKMLNDNSLMSLLGGRKMMMRLIEEYQTNRFKWRGNPNDLN